MSQDKDRIYQENIQDPDLKEKITEVIFAPGCFDDFEGTQEELDELVNAIHEAIANGDFLKNSQPLDEEDLQILASRRPDLFDTDDTPEIDDEFVEKAELSNGISTPSKVSNTRH